MAKKKTKIKLKPLLITAIILGLIIILFVKLCEKNNSLVGKWTTENGTIYQFDKDYTGKLITQLGDFKFKYNIDDDEVFVDFDSEKSKDTRFKFYFEGEELIFENSNGKFIFTKMKEDAS